MQTDKQEELIKRRLSNLPKEVVIDLFLQVRFERDYLQEWCDEVDCYHTLYTLACNMLDHLSAGTEYAKTQKEWEKYFKEV